MACFALGAAAVLGATALRWGFAADTSMLLANLSFLFCSYVATLGFDNVLYKTNLERLLVSFAKKEIDVTGLFFQQAPGPTALGENIWTHRPVSQCVLIKAYAIDTQALHDRIVGQLLASLLLLIIVSAVAILVGIGSIPVSGSGPATGLAISLLTLVVTFVFAIMRVYWPMFEVAQRNLSLVRDAEPLSKPN